MVVMGGSVWCVCGDGVDCGDVWWRDLVLGINVLFSCYKGNWVCTSIMKKLLLMDVFFFLLRKCEYTRT